MRISIVTISFNQAKFLPAAISSVIQQERCDLEYIVVDPGSTDGSLEIIRQFANKINNVILDPDEGPADGLNKGFANASGEIFGFLNSDDLLEPGALASVVQFFKFNPDIDVVSGHSWIIDSNGNRKRRIFSDRFTLGMAKYGAAILSQASTFFRAEIFRKSGGFNPKNRLTWDGELFLDMALVGARFEVVDEFWSGFRVYQGSISGSGVTRNLDDLPLRQTYKKVTGNEAGFTFPLMKFFARITRKFFNPADTLERIRRGPVTQSTS